MSLDNQNKILLSISTGKNRFDIRPKKLDVNWADIKQSLRHSIPTDETYVDFCKFSKDVQDSIKDRGYIVGGPYKRNVRKKTNLIGRWILTFDVDHIGKNYNEIIEKGIGAYDFCVYSTHKHNPDKPRLRIFMPLNRMVSVDEYEPLARKIASKIGIDVFDDTTFQVSRIMYTPTHSHDMTPVFYDNEGEWIDVDTILGEYNNWHDVSEWVYSSRQQRAPRIAQKKAADPTSKPGLIGAFCRAYSIADAIATFIPEAYESTVGSDRYSYTGGTTSNGAVVYDNVFMYSHHESDPTGGMLVNAFDLVRIHLFGEFDLKAREGTPINKMPSQKEMLKHIANDDEVKKELIRENLKDADIGSKGKKLPDWLLKLEVTMLGKIKGTLVNVNLILENDTEVNNRLGYNELTEALVKVADLPWCQCKNKDDGDNWEDIDQIRLMDFLGRKYKMEIKRQVSADAAHFIAYQNTFHPVKDYLNELIWDGKPRIEKLLSKYLGVEENTYTNAVGKKTFCAAVARVFNPGVKFDYLTILEGKQGIGKSTFIKTLAGRWFGDNVNSFKGKEAIEAMQGNWVIELSELEVFGKTEIENVKSFLSRTVDRARMAYGMHPKNFPRRCVFIGTTNDSTYLKDDTGNRRFWPVKCNAKSIDIKSLKEERDQIWAEAVVLYKAGESLYLTQLEESLAAKEQQLRVPDEGWLNCISEWLDEPITENNYTTQAQTNFDTSPKNKQRDKTHAAEIWVYCLGGEIKDLNNARRKQIDRTMKQIEGWEKRDYGIRFGNGAKVRGFIRIKEMEVAA